MADEQEPTGGPVARAGEAQQHSGKPKTCNDKFESTVDHVFESIGFWTASNPWKSILLTVLIALGLGSRMAALESETRPEEQWVPTGSASLDDMRYAAETWPSTMRFNWHIAECKAPCKEAECSCNILDQRYIARLASIYKEIKDIKLDGHMMVDKMEKDHMWMDSEWKEGEMEYQGKTDRGKFRGRWTFNYQIDEDVPEGSDEDRRTSRKCFEFGPFCAKQLFTDIFRDDEKVITRLDDAAIGIAVNFWEKQNNPCMVSIARPDSPCLNAKAWKEDAQELDCQCDVGSCSDAQKQNCRKAALKYCHKVCQTMTVCAPGNNESCAPTYVNEAECEDAGCIMLEGAFSSGQCWNDPDPNAWCGGGGPTAPAADNDGDDAPEGAFEFEPFPLNKALGGIERDTNGDITRATTAFGYHALNEDPILTPDQAEWDPIADWWEMEALCILGITAKQYNETHATPLRKDCPEDELISFSAMFFRSLSDTFGEAIVSDLPKLGGSYGAMIVYLICTLSRRDHVHSAWGMSLVVVITVVLSYASCFGMGQLLGQKNNNLNNNIPFLLLGLGVDDAFVLYAEYNRACKMHPKASIERQVALACRNGGVSIFITSLTDGIAFLIGSMTVLPALSWFCTFAGLGVLFCFVFQLTFFLPCMTLNAKRAETGRYDCLCCFKGEPRSMFEPRGCCRCLTCRDGTLERVLRDGFGQYVAVKRKGQAAVLFVFTALLATASFGISQNYADFRIEWFIPDDVYVNVFLTKNDEMFNAGYPVTAYTKDIDHYASQSKLDKLSKYLLESENIDQEEAITDWNYEFREWATDPVPANFRAEAGANTFPIDGESLYYRMLHEFLGTAPGARYRANVDWNDAPCNEYDEAIDCDLSKGIKATRVSATINKVKALRGGDRFEVMEALRADLAGTIGFSTDEAIFFGRDFIYWEEVGVIREELVRNLLICGAVVCAIVAVMIPRPRIAFLTILVIVLAIVDVLGFCYFWDVTISGISTIYTLIGVGLAVDFAAHIAHCFNHARGTSEARTLEALGRIGPCVFHAAFTLFLAVAVMALSTTYIFRVFFKVFFLVVVFGGLHGLVLLPVLLALLGGSSEGSEISAVHAVEEKIQVQGVFWLDTRLNL
jgi:predicted RND superfamily exporter protein